MASLSPKPRGQPQTQPQAQSQQHLNNKFAFEPNPNHPTQISALRHKISFMQQQLHQLSSKLSLAEKICAQKTQRILILENRLLMNQNSQNGLKSKQGVLEQQVRGRQIIREVPVYKQIIREVPVGQVIDRGVEKSRIINNMNEIKVRQNQYVREVKNIKQNIISCNLANFDIFQNQFTQILQQRNKMNQKMRNLKKQAKQSSKLVILQKHLKAQKQKNKQLSLKLQSYEQQIQILKDQINKMQNEIQLIQSKSHNQSINISNMNEQQLADGKAGLEWQKVVKHCLIESINRLQNLENRMRQDCEGKYVS